MVRFLASPPERPVSAHPKMSSLWNASFYIGSQLFPTCFFLVSSPHVSFFLSDEATKLVYKEGTDHQQQQQLLFRCFNAQLMEICGHMCRLRSNQRCLSETFLLLFTGALHRLKEAMQIFIAISILVPSKLLCRILLVLNVKEARSVSQSSLKVNIRKPYLNIFV